MKLGIAARPHTSGNLAQLELLNIERFGVYTRLHFEDRSYTNLEELRYAGSLARLLREYSVGTGDRVVVMMPNSPELTAAFPAIWTIGATIVPVIPQWTSGEVADVLRNSEATVALTVPSLANRMDEARLATGSLRRLLVFGESDISEATNIAPLLKDIPPLETPVDRSPSDMAILLYTSGTTGTPKGVMLTHENFLAGLAAAFRQNPEMDPGTLLHTLPLTHVYGVLVQSLANGWGLSRVLLRQFEPRRAFEAIEQHRVRYFPVVPTMLVYLLNHPERERYNTSSLFRITSGGAALPEKLRQDTERIFGCRVDQGYGLSESSSVATGYEIRAPYRPGSVGRASPGIEICIVDDQNRTLPPYRVGEICLAGANITVGYWRDPTATSQALSGGWLRTGDVGYLDEEGFLFITDRKKDLIIKGGENISPREIEEALYLHPDVAEAAVVGIPDPVFGEEVCAVVQLRASAHVSEDEIRGHVAKYVTKFKLPARIVFVPLLPKNSNGKIVKRDVRAQLAASYSVSS
jgi:long-chain acyl-CoA synthetase